MVLARDDVKIPFILVEIFELVIDGQSDLSSTKIILRQGSIINRIVDIPYWCLILGNFFFL